MVSDKRAKYLQKRKKKLQAKASFIRLEQDLERTLEKIRRIDGENPYAFHEDKLSSRIVALAEVVAPEVEDVETFRMVCEAVITGWNVAVRGECVLPETVPPEHLARIRILAEQKKRIFPEDNRYVTDYFWGENGRHLVVQGELEEA